MSFSFPQLLLAIICSLLACSCASQRNISQDRVLSNGTAEVSSAIRSDYLVRSGAVLTVGFSNGSRYFVEDGGSLEGFTKGIRKTQVFAEKGANLSDNLQKSKSSKQLRLVETADASKAYSERNKPWNQEGSGGRSGHLSVYPTTYYGWGWYGHHSFYGGRSFYGGGSRGFGRSRGFSRSRGSGGSRGFSRSGSSRGRAVSARAVGSSSVRRRN